MIAPLLPLRFFFSRILFRVCFSPVGLGAVFSPVGLGAVLAGGVCIASPAIAHAQSAEEIAGARALAKQGFQAYQAEDWQQAYELFRRAESLYHAPPHLLYMARASEKLGNLVEARELYNRILRENLASDAPGVFVEAQHAASEEIKTVEPRLARVTIQLEGPNADQVQVLANGKPVPPALIGAPRPMDPGQYEFTVESDVAKADPVTVKVEEGGSETVTIQLIEVVPPPEPVASDTVPPPAEPVDRGTKSSPIPAYVAFGVGAVGLGVGTAFLISHFDQQGQADSRFDDGNCDRDGQCTQEEQEEIQELSSSAATAGTLSLVGFGVGAAAIGTGVVLLLLSSDDATEQANRYDNERHVRPLVGFGSLGLSGRF